MDVLKDALTLLDETRTREQEASKDSFRRDIPFAEVDLEVSHPAASWPAQFKSFEFMFMCMLPERRDQQIASYIQA